MRMRKRAYRAQRIKTLDVDRIAEQIAGRRVVVATDVAKVDMVSAIEMQDGTLVALVKWKNPGELRSFVSLVTGLSRHAERVACVQEPTGTYGDPLRFALLQGGLDVFRVSPKHVHDMREVYDGTPSSHDAKAARVIADIHRRGMSSPWREDAGRLDSELRTYEWFQDEKLRLQGRLEARMARHWPEASAELDLSGTTFLRLIQHYGTISAIAADAEAAGRLMRSVGRGLLKPERVQVVLQSAATTVGVPMSANEAEELRMLAAEMLRVKAHLKHHEKRLASLGETVPCVRDLSTVVGTTTAVILVTLLGDPSDYPSAAAYVKALGLNLREHSSGKKKGQLAITKRGPGLGRKLLYFATMRLVQKDALFKAWHERKKARSGPREGKKSIIALCRKLAAALWHVGQGAAFRPDRLLNMPQPVPSH